MRSSLVSVIDRTALVFCIFLFCLLWSRFFIRNIIICICVASVFCFVLTCLLFLVINKKQSDKLLNKMQLQKIQNINDFFTCNNMQKIKKVLEQKLSANFISENTFIIKNNVFYLLLKQNVTEQDVLQIIKQDITIKNFNIIGIDFSEQVKTFCEKLLNINVKLYQAKDLLLIYNFDVDDIVNQIRFKQKEKLKLKNILLLFIQEKNFKGYIFSGVVLVLSSLIIRQNVYYYVFASILFLLAFLCKFVNKIKRIAK